MSETPPTTDEDETGSVSLLRGAASGAAAAAVWLASEPALKRLTGLDYSEVRLLGRLVAPNGPWKPIGTVMHLANGALFGTAFAALGGRGWKQGLVAAQVESAVLWPGMAIVDRIHEDRRNGDWPRLLTDGRVFAHEAAGHAVFGVVLGLLTSQAGSGR